ncbi:DUF6875 domain-containing protein [Streptosporangium sp. NPDC023615]|uniref:DUF6875 domain-containing protein n=1 Tax=Streptosporangium sp. NPDC023615 TaxID=3154794 RepID=UPI00342497C5
MIDRSVQLLVRESLTSAARSENISIYQEALSWVEGFVAQRDPRINRAGPVCPRVGSALRADQIWLISAHAPGGRLEEARSAGRALIDLFHELFPEPRAFRAGALLCLFPDLPADLAAGFIDEGHRLLRMEFVSRGLMLGEFHPDSRVASVHNPDFLVMRSPVPMFAVRALSPHDLLFLDNPATPPHIRIEYLTWYLHYLDLGDTPRRRVERRIQELR